MKTIATSAFALAIGLLASIPASYAAQVGLQFVETSVDGGPDTLAVFWSSDPSAVFSITGSTDDWTISLVGSGHTTIDSNVNIFNRRSNGTLTWVDEGSTFNNLTRIDDNTYHLVSEANTIGSINNNGGFGLFGNSVSVGAGVDNNGDEVFASVSEIIQAVPEPASMAILAVGMVGLSLIRSKRADDARANHQI
jgi:hypothetical protein